MTLASDSPILQGSFVIEDRGVEDGDGVKVECKNCESVTVLRKDWMGGYLLDYWQCSSCLNILALYADGTLRQPVESFIIPGVFPFGDSLEVAGDDGEYTVMREDSSEITEINRAVILASRQAKREDHALGCFNVEYHNVHLVLNGKDPVGYLTWGPARNDYLVLRELYLAPSYRRRGIGSALVEYWWEDVGSDWHRESGEEFYHVEAPNEDMIRLLVSIGHGEEGSGPTAYKHQVM